MTATSGFKTEAVIDITRTVSVYVTPADAQPDQVVYNEPEPQPQAQERKVNGDSNNSYQLFLAFPSRSSSDAVGNKANDNRLNHRRQSNSAPPLSGRKANKVDPKKTKSALKKIFKRR